MAQKQDNGTHAATPGPKDHWFAIEFERDRLKAINAELVALLQDTLPHVEKLANVLATGPISGPVEHLADDIQAVLAKARKED